MLNLTFCFTWMLEETRDIQVRIFSKHLCRNNIECVLKYHPKNFLYIILCRKRKKFTKLQKHNIQAGTWILLYHHLHKYYFKSNIAHWGKKKFLKISRQKFKFLSYSA